MEAAKKGMQGSGHSSAVNAWQVESHSGWGLVLACGWF